MDAATTVSCVACVGQHRDDTLPPAPGAAYVPVSPGVNAGGMESFRRGGKENAWDLMARATRLGRDSAAGPPPTPTHACMTAPNARH